MDTDLTGRTALVTGAARNIGRAIAVALAGAGARTAVVYSGNKDAAQETVRLITDTGGTAEAFGLDLTDLDSVAATADDVTAALGPVDILVNNAAVRPKRRLAEVTPDLWDHVFAVNVRGPFFLAQKFVPGMVARRWGRVINLGGLHGYKGSALRTQVHASKAAVIGMTRGIAFETAPYGVTANVVVPGRIDTERGDVAMYGAKEDTAQAAATVLMRRLGHPADVADMCLFLASDRAGYITGQELFVTGGTFPMVPSAT
ncbi:MAG TPA: SDR family oxidoreductase [Pseudonocardiaceae bacterium]|nr:SDR family oxidoreductase [Pseudonocardiaceae bacterium]